MRIDYEPWGGDRHRQPLGVEAPRVWDDRPSNVSFEWEGDAGAVEAAFARTAHVSRVEVVDRSAYAPPSP